MGKLSTANWPADEPATLIKVRAPEAEEIRRDDHGRRYVWRLDAEAARYFRLFLDVDTRFRVNELTGEIILRGDDDGGDDDPTPAAKPADHRERIRESKPESQTGPPPDAPSGPSIGISGPLKAEHRGVRRIITSSEVSASPRIKQLGKFRERGRLPAARGRR